MSSGGLKCAAGAERIIGQIIGHISFDIYHVAI